MPVIVEPVTIEPATARRPRRSAAETREHILDVAHELFYWDGIRATGIDRIAKEADVRPTTLYRQFASKDDLVAAYVTRDADGYRQLLTDATAPTVGTPRQRILALFDCVDALVQPDHCRGCPFLMALAELPDTTHPAHLAATAVKAWVRDLLHDLARDLADDQPIDDPEALGDQLTLVLEGVYASVQALTAAGPATQAHATANALMTAATLTSDRDAS